MEIRGHYKRLISTLGFLLPVRRHLYTGSMSRGWCSLDAVLYVCASCTIARQFIIFPVAVVVTHVPIFTQIQKRLLLFGICWMFILDVLYVRNVFNVLKFWYRYILVWNFSSRNASKRNKYLYDAPHNPFQITYKHLLPVLSFPGTWHITRWCTGGALELVLNSNITISRACTTSNSVGNRYFVIFEVNISFGGMFFIATSPGWLSSVHTNGRFY